MHTKSACLALLELAAWLCFCPLVHAQAGPDDAPARSGADMPPDVAEYLRNVKQYSERKVDLSHFVVNEEDPESNLPTPEEAAGRPVAFAEMTMDVTRLGAQARARGEWAKAVKFDRVLVRFAREKALGFGFLCSDLEKLGQRDEALKVCGMALEKEGVRSEDFANFVRLVLSRHQGLDPVEVEDAKSAIAHLVAADSSRLLGYQLQCQLGLATKDDAALERCATELMKLAPQDRKSIGAAWSAALKKRDFTRAHELLASATGAGMSAEELAIMQDLTDEKEAEGSVLKSLQLKAGHPMLRWLVGLIVAIVACTYAARKLARTRSA
jgi:hypothetical protein